MKKISILFIGTILATAMNAQLPTRSVKAPSNTKSVQGIESTPPVHTLQPTAPQGVQNQRPNLREEMMQGSTTTPDHTNEKPSLNKVEAKTHKQENKVSGGPISGLTHHSKSDNPVETDSNILEKRSSLTSGLPKEKALPKNKGTQNQRKVTPTRSEHSGGLPETK
jgi:hypothetical protein